MKRYEIYLPLKYNDGKGIEPEKIKRVREELIAVFGALTVSPVCAVSRKLEIRRRDLYRRYHQD
jgi:hypothetical protein